MHEPLKFTFPDLGTISVDTQYVRPSFVDQLIAMVEVEEAEAETPDATQHWAKILQHLYDVKASLG